MHLDVFHSLWCVTVSQLLHLTQLLQKSIFYWHIFYFSSFLKQCRLLLDKNRDYVILQVFFLYFSVYPSYISIIHIHIYVFLFVRQSITFLICQLLSSYGQFVLAKQCSCSYKNFVRPSFRKSKGLLEKVANAQHVEC